MRKIILTAVVMMAALSMGAQHRKPVAAKTAATAEHKQQEPLLFREMLPSTAQIVIIDSVSVPKQDMLKALPLPESMGRLLQPENFAVGSHESPGSVFINEFGDQAYLQGTDSTGNKAICRSNYDGKSWTQPVAVDGISSNIYRNAAFPFVMPDGTTLFFAAEGSQSMGGYDVFTTQWDNAHGRYYEPENYGLPFNSTANDYLVAIDDQDSLGWIVSDRYQPEGYVCVYTFVTGYPRKNYDASTPNAVLTSRAKISSYKDTWDDNEETVGKGLNRLSALRKQHEQGSSKAGSFSFAINDGTVYHSLSDFKSETNRSNFAKVESSRKQLEARMEQLEDLRSRYHEGSANEKAALRPQILKLEKDTARSYEAIKAAEKKIRELENVVLRN